MKNNYTLKLYNMFCKTRQNASYTPNQALQHTTYKTHIQRTLTLLLSIWLLSGAEAQAQNNVGIGTTTPNSKAILELQATDKGLLTPRMTNAQMLAITTPPNGLLVYNTTANCFYYFDNVSNTWKNMCSIAASGNDTLVLNLVQIDSLFAHLIKTDTLLSKTIITNYLKADSAYIKQLIANTINSQYIITDSIEAGFGRFDSIYINGQNLTSYLNTLISSKDTVTIKYLRTDSIYSILIKADSAFIKSILTNTLTAHNITTDSLYAHFGKFDSLYIGGKNISQIVTDSIAAQAWLKKGNAGTNASTNFIGTRDAQDLVFKTNSIENMRILNTNGNVGIGTSTPTAKLEVNSGTAAVSGLKLTQLSGMNSTSTSNYPTVMYSGVQMEPGNPGFVYDRTNTVFYTTAVAGKTIKRSTGAFAFTTLTTTLATYGASCAALDASGSIYMRNNDDVNTSVNNKIIKITAANVITYIASGIQSGNALAVDASGDIYYNGNVYDPRIWKTTQGGVVTLFNADLEDYTDLQFDNSGVLYACGGGIIYKFTAAGVRSVFASNISGVRHIKFDPSGQLYAGSSNGTIYKVSNVGIPTVYVTGVGNVSQMDFDASNNLLFVDITSGILYTISATTLASTTVLSVDNVGNVIASSSNGISNNANVYNNVPGSMTVNGKLYVEEDFNQLPYQNEHVVNITNTAIDLGTQMTPYLAKYKTIRFVLPANSIFTWNVPIQVAAFQAVNIQGTGNSNLSNITSQINMTVNRVFVYAGISYKDVMRAQVASFGVLGLIGVFINHTHNDPLPIGTGGVPALFYMGGTSPKVAFEGCIINSAEHVTTGSYLANGIVHSSYVNVTKNVGSPYANIEWIYTPGQPWSFGNTQRFIIYRYPGTVTTFGAGVNLDMASGKIVQM